MRERHHHFVAAVVVFRLHLLMYVPVILTICGQGLFGGFVISHFLAIYTSIEHNESVNPPGTLKSQKEHPIGLHGS